jgi:acyl carrier protein
MKLQRLSTDEIFRYSNAMAHQVSENEQKLRRAFASGLRLEESAVHDNLKYEDSAGWDSVAHMALVAALDEAFDIMLDTDDVIDMSSYAKARQILGKYGIQF